MSEQQSTEQQTRANTLGILGGGQLGRMLVHAAQRMGVSTCVLDPDANAGAAQASNDAILSTYDNTMGLDALASRCAHITTEFENVPARSLQRLSEIANTSVSPSAKAVQIAQNRVAEKQFFEQCAAQGGPGPVPWAAIESVADITKASKALLPGILKTTQLGYDGKGQAPVADHAGLQAAWEKLGFVPCVLEQRVDLAAECSVVLARGHDGQVVTLPLQVNVHRNGILHTTAVGMPLPAVFGCFNPVVCESTCLNAAKNIANALQYVGVLCVEFFVLNNGAVCVNEIAPRPHNSGHHSLDSCSLSQFELQARAALHWPLVEPRLHSSAMMLNLLGDLWVSHDKAPPFAKLLGLPGVHLHLYGKADARPGRKMGHVTVTGASAAQVQATFDAVLAVLGLTA